MVVTIHASDNAAWIQSVMLGFERRQYEATLDAELQSIERDLTFGRSVAVQRQQ